MIDTGLAFLEGLALIASPCILPVLPIVLAASIDGGRRRPFGIIIGFVLSFSLFALFSRKLVVSLGLDLDIVRNASLFFLLAFALVLLSSRLSEKFGRMTSGAANLGDRLAKTSGTGLTSGILIGSFIGLVWTPCAGPILAAVLVEVIRQKTDVQGDLVILSFALGAAMPMLAISLAGRRLLKKLGWLVSHLDAVRKAFAALIIASVAFIASGVDAQSLFVSSKPAAASATSLENGLANPYPAPGFAGIKTWLNSPALAMTDLKGKVVLVDFWTYSCINCVRTLPYITAWDRKYRQDGLVIVGIHSPEFEFEKNPGNVEAAIAKYGIHYPVALDNDLSTWANFDNQYWPAHYLIDRQGKVVYTHFGEGDYGVTENNIRYLLGLKGMAGNSPPDASHASDQTPETYLGYARAESFFGSAVRDAVSSYRLPASIPADSWALSGKWQIESEKIVSASRGAALDLHFKASHVFLVLGTKTGKPVDAEIRLNGNPVGGDAGMDAPAGKVKVMRNTLYELIDLKKPEQGLIEIRSDSPGLEAYAFTFG